MAKVSVILTSFNHAKYICEAIDSIINQTFSDFELIILDDVSSDNSWDLIKQYTDPRIKAFQSGGKGEVTERLNNAIYELATGEYIAIHHSDDVWELDKLEKQVDFLDANSNIGAVFSNALPIDQRGMPLTDEAHFYYNIFSQPNRSRYEWLRYFFLIGNALCHPSVLIRKQCYLDCGVYSEILGQLPDFDMWIRLCARFEIYVMEERLIKFRILDNEMNTSGSRPVTRIRSANEHYKLLQQYRSLSRKDNIFKIFPDFISYDRGEYTDPEYVLARVCLASEDFFARKLLAIDILFDILNNPSRRQAIEKIYGFSANDFIDITGQNDLFLREEILKLRSDITKRDEKINEAHIAERDQAIRNFTEIRGSVSWKLTAPLRFFGHLYKGNFDHAGNVVHEVGRRIICMIPKDIANLVFKNYVRLSSVVGVLANSSANHAAIAAIVSERCSFTREALELDPLASLAPRELVAIDIGIVTYNSARWITSFVNSLIELDYPKSLLSVCFVDNSSTDSTFRDLHEVVPKLRAAGFTVEIIQQPNNGYGAGHNTAISKGTSPFCLVTNIDITFESDALRRVVTVALADNGQTATWELRQKPYEHPKFYDPVTGITNWNSHACVLLRRSALDQAGGYDENLFMYGEDVEMSYRLRRAGFLLRYCPQAVVWHYSYESAVQIKPIQYIGSTFANLYLRLKYGNCIDALSIPMLGLRLLMAPEAYLGSRHAILRSLLKLFVMAPKALLGRRRSDIYFPFRTWDYELNREGAFVEQHALPLNPPLVSIITRTYRGRELFLRQALLSVAHQTYPNIEHIVVEDGGESMRTLVTNIIETTGRSIQFIKLDKLGRSATGNAGLSVAKGRWCLFLDDDDLLFSDHIENLVNTLIEKTDTVAAYSLAWEIPTQTSELDKGEFFEIDHRIPSALRQEFDYKTLLNHNFMPIQSVLFNRQLFEERGGFEEDMDALEDWVLWKKYAALGNQFAYLPKVTSMYRIPSEADKIRQRIDDFHLAYPLALARNVANE